MVAALITVSASLGFASLSSAAPSKQQVRQAKERLDALNRELSLLVEQYDQARLRLQDVQARLAEVQQAAERAQAEAERAAASLNRSAARAYTGIGSQMEVLFDATSIADFSDRLEFIGSMAQADADLATAAARAKQQARWTADELKATVDERRGILEDIGAKREQIQGRISEARTLYAELNKKYHDALAAAAAAQRAGSQTTPSPGGSPIPPPPAPNANVAAVLAAAYSVIGTPYAFGGASPETGFDCSGFTMWAWAQVGVYLPHSSTAQYASVPQVARDQLQPGDLVFSSYGRLGSGVVDHVGIYVGGGRMIASSNPGETVGVQPVDWSAYVGAGRPG